MLIALGRLPGATTKRYGKWLEALGPPYIVYRRRKKVDRRRKIVDGLRRRWPKGPANLLKIK